MKNHPGRGMIFSIKNALSFSNQCKQLIAFLLHELMAARFDVEAHDRLGV